VIQPDDTHWEFPGGAYGTGFALGSVRAAIFLFLHNINRK